ncbi:MAG: hypothetical protein ABH823_01105 [bacterium]
MSAQTAIPTRGPLHVGFHDYALRVWSDFDRGLRRFISGMIELNDQNLALVTARRPDARVVALGAGSCVEFDLGKLLESAQEVTVVDIRSQALDKLEESHHDDRLKLVRADLSLFGKQFYIQAEEIVAQSETWQEAEQKLLRFVAHDLTMDTDPFGFVFEDADVVIVMNAIIPVFFTAMSWLVSLVNERWVLSDFTLQTKEWQHLLTELERVFFCRYLEKLNNNLAPGTLVYVVVSDVGCLGKKLPAELYDRAFSDAGFHNFQRILPHRFVGNHQQFRTTKMAYLLEAT